MKRHDTIDLWNYAAKGLQAEDGRFTEEHLLDCPDCQATLERVRKAQDVLGTARFAQPQFKLANADAAIAREISQRILKQARPLRWRWVAAPLAVAVGALLGLAIQTGQDGHPVAQPEAAQLAALPEAIAQDGAQIEKSVELQRAGDVLTTGARGHAWIRLPDTSRLKLAASSRIALTAVSPKAIDLHLDRGRVAVHAAHVPREAFTVRTGDVTVHVLGTTFAVSRGSDWVEVAVSEGRVGVESPRGLPFFVSAGERVRVGIKSWRPVSRAISGPLKDELKEIGTSVATAPQAAPPATGGKSASSAPQLAARTSQEAALVVPLVVTPLEQQPVSARGANEVPPDWAPMPNSRAPVGLRGIAEPNPPQPEVVAQAPAQPAAQAAPAAQVAPLVQATPIVQAAPPPAAVPASSPVVSSSSPVQDAAPPAAAAPAEPAAAQTAQATAPPPPPPPAKAAPETRGPMPEDLEELFLMRAERALRNGGCDRYLLGLADIAEDPQKTVRQERARIAMARCQQALGQPEAAAQEFARYLRDFPKGLFAREATAAAAAQPASGK